MGRPLTVEQCAEQAQCHPETIRRAIRKGELKARKNRLAQGTPHIVDEDDFKVFVRSRTGLV